VAVEISRTKYKRLDLHEGRRVLDFIWLPTSTEQSDEEFRNDLLEYCDALDRNGCKNVMVDLRDHHYTPGFDIGPWWTSEVGARYNRMNVQRTAYVHRQDRPLPPETPPTEERCWHERHFHDPSAAHEWLES
jgi:hypothetical protein